MLWWGHTSTYERLPRSRSFAQKFIDAVSTKSGYVLFPFSCFVFRWATSERFRSIFRLPLFQPQRNSPMPGDHWWELPNGLVLTLSLMRVRRTNILRCTAQCSLLKLRHVFHYCYKNTHCNRAGLTWFYSCWWYDSADKVNKASSKRHLAPAGPTSRIYIHF